MTFTIVPQKTPVMLPTLPTLQLPSVESSSSVLSNLSLSLQTSILRSLPQCSNEVKHVNPSTQTVCLSCEWVQSSHSHQSMAGLPSAGSCRKQPLLNSFSLFLLSAWATALSCCASGVPWLTRSVDCNFQLHWGATETRELRSFGASQRKDPWLKAICPETMTELNN